jgi:anaerobic selenocysteine-containing dehydrogenase
MMTDKKKVSTMCINCSTICGIIAHVENGKVVKVEGNPLDPNSRGHICAKGHASINMLYDPNRILYPLKRVGNRGEGKWKRISWEEALDEVVSHLKPIKENGYPEQLVFQYGRDCTNGILDRFTDAFGTPNKVGHRGLCSLNKRMAIKAAIGDTDWDTNDVAHSEYLLNFGSNLYEAHQGHVPFLQRVAESRVKNKAKLVTFDVRLSNTAARSDEWFPVFPSTDGLIALAMGNVIMQEGLYDKEFLDHWTTFPSDQLKEYLSSFTVEWAEQESGVPARDIKRIAIEFAKAAPRCTTISNRGSHAHANGFYNESAVIMLNAIVGNIGKKGGWCYIAGKINEETAPQPKPIPSKPRVQTELSHPSDFPFANMLYPRAVSTTIYPTISSGMAEVKALITYYVNAPMSWPEGPTRVQDIYLDEEKIPFHVAIDAFYSESTHLADIILPDATFLEKWDLDARNSYELVPYIGLRQPVVKPAGESKDIREILRDIAIRIGNGMEQYFQYSSAEEYVREWAKNIPGGLHALKQLGFYWDEQAKLNYEPYKKVLTDTELKVSVVDQNSGMIRTKEGNAIGLFVNGKPYKGFDTPTRKFQIYHSLIEQLNNQKGTTFSALPTYKSVINKSSLANNQCILTTFKWNVHTQSRTMNQKWLAEIVHDNPMWINKKTADLLEINNGDLIELSSETDSMLVRAHVTEGIHPKVVAVSASLGHTNYGPVASEKTIPPSIEELALSKDQDVNKNKWWTTTGYNPNSIIPSVADPLGGGQAWNNTIVVLKKVRV